MQISVAPSGPALQVPDPRQSYLLAPWRSSHMWRTDLNARVHHSKTNITTPIGISLMPPFPQELFRESFPHGIELVLREIVYELPRYGLLCASEFQSYIAGFNDHLASL